MASEDNNVLNEAPVVLEELTSDGEGSGLEVEQVDSQEGPESSIQVPFDPAKIDVITQARTVDLLLTRLKEEELDLSPDFQRRDNIWDEKRKSSLIESMLLRIPIPSLYVSEDKDGNYTVVDGLQRLCAIAHFVDAAALNKAVKRSLNPLRLSGLQSLLDHRGKSFAELPRPLQRRIKETELTLHIIRASTPKSVKFNIFSRINQGGLPLTAQEIRNAIYGEGQWRARVRRLAESEQFLAATEHKIKLERMEDIELVLRFVALYTFNSNRLDDQNLDDFLNDTVEKRSILWDEDTWANIETAFYRALTAASQVFGKFAFRKYFGPDQSRRPINRGLFETETVLLARRSHADLSLLASRSERLLEKVAELFNTNRDFFGATLYATGRGSSSNKRLEMLDKAFVAVLNA